MTPRFARVPAHLAGAQDLSARDLRVFICIALHADGAGQSHPSLSRIATITGINRRHVSLSVRRLEEGGHLQRRLNKGASGAWANSVYKIIFKDPDRASGAAQEEGKRPGANEQTIERTGQKRGEDRVIADSMLQIWQEECREALPIAKPRARPSYRVSGALPRQLQQRSRTMAVVLSGNH
jgi:Helix-turn-helix domain